MQNSALQNGERERAKRSLLARLKKPPDLGTYGKITWTRDEIYELRGRPKPGPPDRIQRGDCH